MTRRMFATVLLTVFLTALLAACNLVGSPEEPIDQTAVPSNTPVVTDSVSLNATSTINPTVTSLPFITRQPPHRNRTANQYRVCDADIVCIVHRDFLPRARKYRLRRGHGFWFCCTPQLFAVSIGVRSRAEFLKSVVPHRDSQYSACAKQCAGGMGNQYHSRWCICSQNARLPARW